MFENVVRKNSWWSRTCCVNFFPASTIARMCFLRPYLIPQRGQSLFLLSQLQRGNSHQFTLQISAYIGNFLLVTPQHPPPPPSLQNCWKVRQSRISNNFKGGGGANSLDLGTLVPTPSVQMGPTSLVPSV